MNHYWVDLLAVVGAVKPPVLGILSRIFNDKSFEQVAIDLTRAGMAITGGNGGRDPRR